MATLRVVEFTGARASGDYDTGKRDYTRLFRVLTDSNADSALQVGVSAGIPRLGDIYSANGSLDTSAVCLKVDVQQDSENPRVWVATCAYGEPNVNSQNGQNNPNPLLRPAVVTFGFNKTQRIVYKDINGKPLLNSALDYFDPPLSIDDSRPTLTVVRNEPSFDPSIAVAYQDAVNSDSFFGASPGQAKVAGISAVSQTENNYFFWQVSYTIEFRWDGWQPVLLDYGRNAIYVNTNTGAEFKGPVFQKDKKGNEIPNVPVTEPVPLDGNGNELINPTPDTVKKLPFTVYRSLPFSQLSLP